MAVSVLLEIDDFLSDDFGLIAIISSLEDYRLAYYINKYCQISLHKSSKPLVLTKFEIDTPFTIFHYEDEADQIYWSLISNRSFESHLKYNQNFELEEVLIVSEILLIPECENANYFLKIDNFYDHTFIKSLINSLNSISGINCVYEVDKHTLVSINNLLF